MKKAILLSAVMFLAIITASAGDKFGLGVKFAWNTTDYSLALDDISPARSNGSSYGLFLKLGLGERGYIQPEFLYSTMDIDTPISIGGKTSDYTLELRTFEIPLLLGYKIIDFKIANISLIGGPSAAFPTSSSLLDVTGGEVDESDFALKNAIWGLNAGVALDLPLGFGVDVRYKWDLSPVGDTDSALDISENNKFFTIAVSKSIF